MNIFFHSPSLYEMNHFYQNIKRKANHSTEYEQLISMRIFAVLCWLWPLLWNENIDPCPKNQYISNPLQLPVSHEELVLFEQIKDSPLPFFSRMLSSMNCPTECYKILFRNCFVAIRTNYFTAAVQIIGIH